MIPGAAPPVLGATANFGPPGYHAAAPCGATLSQGLAHTHGQWESEEALATRDEGQLHMRIALDTSRLFALTRWVQASSLQGLEPLAEAVESLRTGLASCPACFGESQRLFRMLDNVAGLLKSEVLNSGRLSLAVNGLKRFLDTVYQAPGPGFLQEVDNLEFTRCDEASDMNGHTRHLINMVRSGNTPPESCIVNVVRYHGKLFSLNNKRLLALKTLQLERDTRHGRCTRRLKCKVRIWPLVAGLQMDGEDQGQDVAEKFFDYFATSSGGDLINPAIACSTMGQLAAVPMASEGPPYQLPLASSMRGAPSPMPQSRNPATHMGVETQPPMQYMPYTLPSGQVLHVPLLPAKMDAQTRTCASSEGIDVTVVPDNSPGQFSHSLQGRQSQDAPSLGAPAELAPVAVTKPSRGDRVRQLDACLQEFLALQFDEVEPCAQEGLTLRMLTTLRRLEQSQVFWKGEQKRREAVSTLLMMPQALADQIGDVRRRGEACVSERQFRKAFDVLSEVKALVNTWRSEGGTDASAAENMDSSPSSKPKHQWFVYFDEANKRKWWWCSDNVRWFYADDPTSGWQQFREEGGRLWWWNEKEADHFFEDQCEQTRPDESGAK